MIERFRCRKKSFVKRIQEFQGEEDGNQVSSGLT